MSNFTRRFVCILTVVSLIAACSKQEDRSDAPGSRSGTTTGVVEVDGAELSYFTEGAGIPCVVTGIADVVARELSQNLRNHFKFVFVNQRNFGFSDSDKLVDYKNVTVRVLVDDIEKVRQALGFEKIAVLGHSAHGLIALEYAMSYPKNTSHVILIASPPHWITQTLKAQNDYWETHASDARKEILKSNWQEILSGTVPRVSAGREFVQRDVANGPKNWYDSTYDATPLWRGIEMNTNAINHFFGVVLKDHDRTDSFPRITAPVFLALGQYDFAVPHILWDDHESKLPNLSCNLFDKSGHFPMLEEQVLFDKKLIEWVADR